jgi:hypothetical protein
MPSSASPYKRGLTFQPKHQLEYGLRITARSGPEGKASTVHCKFCHFFEREQVAGKKRRTIEHEKVFLTGCFIPFQYRQHLLTQHLTRWEAYKTLSISEKKVYFCADDPDVVDYEDEMPEEERAVTYNDLYPALPNVGMAGTENATANPGDDALLQASIADEKKRKRLFEVGALSVDHYARARVYRRQIEDERFRGGHSAPAWAVAMQNQLIGLTKKLGKRLDAMEERLEVIEDALQQTNDD